MNKYLILIFVFTTLFSSCQRNIKVYNNIYIKGANSRITYFDVHEIDKAWEYSKGKNINVGILDHLFGINDHNDLYSGCKSFLSKSETIASNKYSEHGFWMASTLKEIAPDVNVYGLTTLSSDEDKMVKAMIDAIDWSIENDLDILTYSAGRISEPNRALLDKAINKAYENGIITIFLHNPNPHNFLPSDIEPPINGIDNSSDLKISKFDYSVILGKDIDKNGNVDTSSAFKSISSKAPVLAGIISLMKETNPSLNIDEIHEILMDTRYTFENYNTMIRNAVNAYTATKMCYERKMGEA